jgi:penicillin-insensitive murein endopeptidase
MPVSVRFWPFCRDAGRQGLPAPRQLQTRGNMTGTGYSFPFLLKRRKPWPPSDVAIVVDTNAESALTGTPAGYILPGILGLVHLGGEMSSIPTGRPVQAGSLRDSVGHHGTNHPSDVTFVQTLLNNAGAGIKVDGKCGHATISAIEEYQANWSRHHDGRVDPNGNTWRHLLEGKLKIKRVGFQMLPQVCADGYYSYPAGNDAKQFGTPATIRALIRIVQKFSSVYPDLEIGIGDLSYANGAEMKPHKAHRSGRNVDIRPLRKDGREIGVRYTSISDYSRERTKALVQIILADHNCKSILFNDTAIPGVTHFHGHDDHLHVNMKE